MKTLSTWFFCALLSVAVGHSRLSAQGVSITDSGTSPDAKAILDLSSDSQGLLIPRMLESERTGIASPADGLLVYQTDNNAGFYYYDGTVWLPWRKNIIGSVTMGIASSTIDRGSGFSVFHTLPGRDQVTFTETLTAIPDITLTGEALPGTVPNTPFDYCFSVYENCSDVHISFLRLRNGGSGSPIFFDTGQTLCNPASSNYTYYKLGDPEYTTAPLFPTPFLAPGSSIYLQSSRSTTASAANTNAFTLWIDWDQSGTFDDVNSFGNDERIISESGGITTIPSGPLNLSITLPAASDICSGQITGRMMVRDVNDHQLSCIGDVRGETEDFEIQVAGGQDCSANYPAKLVNCNILGTTSSGFQVNCVDRFGDPINAKYNFKVIE